MAANGRTGKTGRNLTAALRPAVALAVASLAWSSAARADDAAPNAPAPVPVTFPYTLPSDGAPASAPLYAVDNPASPDSGATATTQNTPTGGNYANTPTMGETKHETVAEPAAPEIVAASPEKPNIHGFFNSSFKTAYVTPRGLVVQNEGLVWQPIVGLVFPLGDFGPFKGVAVDGGIWNDVDTAEAGVLATGAWDELDPFAGISAKVGDISLALGYTAFISPQQAYEPEHNADLKISYDDSAMWGKESGFALNPYVDLWVAISGGATVVEGRAGGTGYVEPGIVPTYTFKAVPEYPVTVTIPTYFSVGPRTYWALPGRPGGDFGLFSTAFDATVPLAFVPTKYGFWHGDVGITYDYLINTSLLHAGEILSGNTNRNVLIGSVSVGVNF
jgi:hypothetical protein